jgi:uncharacterized protein (TIGR01319 family)
MECILLIDYGSTYTKVTAVDLSTASILGTSSAFTTVETDVSHGLNNAFDELYKQTGKITAQKTLAASSAAGGLKMVAIGLVPELTAKAASMASMGAGAKVIRSYSFELTEDDIAEIISLSPDILLLTGGTDGGNKNCILHNAKMLSQVDCVFPIIVAGNSKCTPEIKKILANHRAYFCENVMPAIGTLNTEPTRQLIRDIFLERIVMAKGLKGVLMPTPSAVLTAVELLVKGCENSPRLGDLLLVDVGGATTDVYSVGYGDPSRAGTILQGLPEPWAKRTVEGDIGMRYSSGGIIDAVGLRRVAELSAQSEQAVSERVDFIMNNPSVLSQNDEETKLDFALAALAIETATLRHAGSYEEVYTIAGLTYAQTGKDLSETKNLILTGGALIHSENQNELSKFAQYSENFPQSLRPKNAKLLVDREYILASMGLLSSYAPETALKIMLENLT